MLFTAREKKSIFVSFNRGKTFNEILLSSPARNVAYYRISRKELIIVSSNDSFYLSSDGIRFNKVTLNTKGLALRYPTLHLEKIFFSGVGARSWLIAFDLKTSEVDIYDISSLAGDISACRLAFYNNMFFIGSELRGKLYVIDPGSMRKISIKDLVKLHTKSFLNPILRKLLNQFPKVSSILQIA